MFLQNFWLWENWTIGYCRRSSRVMGKSPVKTQLLAIAEIALRKSVLPYSCFPAERTGGVKTTNWPPLRNQSVVFQNVNYGARRWFLSKSKLLHPILGTHDPFQDRHFLCIIWILLLSIPELVTVTPRHLYSRSIAQMKALSFLYRMVYWDVHGCWSFDFSCGWQVWALILLDGPPPSNST